MHACVCLCDVSIQSSEPVFRIFTHTRSAKCRCQAAAIAVSILLFFCFLSDGAIGDGPDGNCARTMSRTVLCQQKLNVMHSRSSVFVVQHIRSGTATEAHCACRLGDLQSLYCVHIYGPVTCFRCACKCCGAHESNTVGQQNDSRATWAVYCACMWVSTSQRKISYYNME